MGMYINGEKVALSSCENKNSSDTPILNDKLPQVLNRTVHQLSKEDFGDITELGDAALYMCQLLEDVELPDTLEVIGNKAFSICSSLTTIKIPKNVRQIGEECFNNNQVMTSIDLSENEMLETVKKDAFKYNGELNVVISDINKFCDIEFETYTANPTYIGHNIWYKDAIGTDITEVNLDTVINVGSYVFYNDPKIENLTIGNSVESIGDWSFYMCPSLVNIDFGNNLKFIGEKTFYGCDSIRSINIPSSVLSIGNYAFATCELLNTIELNEGLDGIGDGAFSGVKNVTNLVIPNSVTYLGIDCFNTGSSSENFPCFSNLVINKESQISMLEERCFKQCGFSSITLPDNLSIIGPECFDSCLNLTKIEIPENVMDIESKAFNNCWNLTTIIFNSVMPPSIAPDAISEYTTHIFVPDEHIDNYKAEWPNLADKIYPISSYDEFPEIEF